MIIVDWFILIYIDLYWFILIYIDLYWFILRFGCKSWVLMILTSKRVWQLLRHFEALRSNAHRIIWRKKNEGHSCSTRMIIIWLVVSLPLCKMMEFVSWDYDIPKMMESHKPVMFQSPPTSNGNNDPVCSNHSWVAFKENAATFTGHFKFQTHWWILGGV